jgi:hypothetical protein
VAFPANPDLRARFGAALVQSGLRALDPRLGEELSRR